MMARQRANGARSAKPARRRKSLSSAPKCDTPKLGQQGGNALADVRDWVTEDRKKVEHLQPFGDHWRNGPPALPLVATPVRGFVRGFAPTLPLVATPVRGFVRGFAPTLPLVATPQSENRCTL